MSSSASVEFMADNGMLYDLETEVNPSLSGLCIFQKNASPDKRKVQRLVMASVAHFFNAYVFLQMCFWIIYFIFFEEFIW